MNKTTVMVVLGLGLIAGYFFLTRRASAAEANGNGASALPNGEAEEGEGAGAIGVLEAQALSGIPPGGLPFNDLPNQGGKGGSPIPGPTYNPTPAPAPSPSPAPPMFREPRRAGAGETYNIP